MYNAYNVVNQRAVQKLYSIRDSKRIQQNNKRNVALNQLPFFILSKGNQMKRLEIVPNGGLGFGRARTTSKENRTHNQRKTIKGNKKPLDKKILIQLPQGTDIEIRPSGKHPFFYHDCRQYEFNLGKAFS